MNLMWKIRFARRLAQSGAAGWSAAWRLANELADYSSYLEPRAAADIAVAKGMLACHG